MNRNSPVDVRLKIVFDLINDCVDNDNIITLSEFINIQQLKEDLGITNEYICKTKRDDIERILYLQLYLLLLDDTFDSGERQEVEYYKQIFGYSEDDILQIEKRVREDKIKDSERYRKVNMPENSNRDRSIPESIKKIVWDRDKGKCVSCGSMEYLEFDHDIPFAKGGSNSTENIRILCRNCNRHKSDNIL